MQQEMDYLVSQVSEVHTKDNCIFLQYMMFFIAFQK